MWPSPVPTLTCGHVTLRALRRSDKREFTEVLETNRLYLQPWSASSPETGEPIFGTFRRALALAREGARDGNHYGWVITLDGSIVGQININCAVWGVTRSAAVGYWVAQGAAGRGVATRATAAVLDYALGGLGLHRIEVLIRPENAASLRVAEKLGLREEGVRERAIHIGGQWRDHRVFAVTLEEFATKFCESVGE